MIYTTIRNTVECLLKPVSGKKNTWFYDGVLYKSKTLGAMMHQIYIEIDEGIKYKTLWVGEGSEREALVAWLVSVELEKQELGLDESDEDEDED